jgi:hypothetical protein
MNHQIRTNPYIRIGLIIVLCCLAIPQVQGEQISEPYASDWQLRIDNDALAYGGGDRNYSGGITFAQSGRRASERWISLDGLLGKIDNLFTLSAENQSDEASETGHSMQFGLLVYTPESVSTSEPIFDDHPYSNLIFMANSRQRISADQAKVTRSSLLVGLLGANTAKTLQSSLHSILDVEESNGWNNQISDGGELTFRYSLSQSRVLKTNYTDKFSSYDISATAEANIGYTTDINAGISLRVGQIHALGWLSLPESSDHFATVHAPLVSGKGNQRMELFFLAGANVRLRAYNVLLQGQFRDSNVTYQYSDLNPLIIEAWVGAGIAFRNGWQVSYIVRARTKEFEAKQSESHAWGGLTLTRVL